MENPILNSGDSDKQTTNQQQEQPPIFIHSRTYGPNRGSSNNCNNSNNNSYKKFSHGRKSGNGGGGHLNSCSNGRHHNSNITYTQGQLQLPALGQRRAYGHGNSNSGQSPLIYRNCYDYQTGRRPTLNATASVYNLRSWSNYEPQQQQQHHQQQSPELHYTQEHEQHLQLQQQQQQQQQTSRSHRLNVSAPSFTPANARTGHDLLPSQSQPQLPSTQTRSPTRSHTDRTIGRRQQLPDLLQTVLKLMRDLDRSVSYPEMISLLSMRLQCLPVELKRHIPHTLHGAVVNGYLRKDGNYYTLLSETEQKEIMQRNEEAAKRAKELEKEPLSWRLR